MNFGNSQKGIGGVALVVILAVVVVAGGAIFYLSGSGEESNVEQEIVVDETMGEEESMSDDNEVMEDDEGMMEDEMAENDSEAEAVTIDLSGRNYEFSQESITVQQGQTVTINFESTQGFHDWVVDEFDASTERVNPGETTSVTFVADQAGEFEYFCSVGNHRQLGMVGTLIVE